MGTVTYTNFGGQIVSENRDGVIRDYVPDTQGSTIALLDDSQNITDTWEYWPYGEVKNHEGPSATLFTFIGTHGYYRGSNGLDYIRARWYSSLTTAWTTVDAYWPYVAPYLYADSSPVTEIDPSGRQSQSPSEVTILGSKLILAYGNYCGGDRNPLVECPKLGLPPIPPMDNVDACCVAHDKDYVKFKCKWNSNVSWECRKSDINLCTCLVRNKCKQKSKKERDHCNAFRKGGIEWFCAVKPNIK